MYCLHDNMVNVKKNLDILNTYITQYIFLNI